jgi:hypothetical protein
MNPDPRALVHDHVPDPLKRNPGGSMQFHIRFLRWDMT